MRSAGRIGLWFLASGFFIYLLFANGKLDLWLARLLYDPTSQAFVWGTSEFVDVVLYRGYKWLMTVVVLGLIVWGIKTMRAHRSEFGPKHLAVGAIGTVCIILAVGLLKKLTGVDCPWSIDAFGGPMPFIPMQDVVRLAFNGQFGQGRCFPAGHSTSGLFLLAWAAAFWHISRFASAWLAAAGMVLGLSAGLVRMAQGAHFLSHVIWAMWFSALLAYLLWFVVLRPSAAVSDRKYEIPS